MRRTDIGIDILQKGYERNKVRQMEKILVIIVTYNGMEWMQRCLDSVFDSTLPADVFIVDNGSTDGTQEYIQNYGKGIIFKQSEENLGFGRANNIGMQYAVDNGYDYAYLLNQDAWIEKDTFEILIKTHKAHPEYGILSPIQIQANGVHMDRNFLNGVASRCIDGNFMEDLYFGNVKDVYEVKDVMAAHWLMTKECLRRTGGFSPTFAHYGEDNNYVDRVEYHRLKSGFVPATTAVHDRENRKDSLGDPQRRINIITLVETSDITRSVPWFRLALRYLQYIYKYKTLKHFKSLFYCIRNHSMIRQNREASRKEGAFLNFED